MLHNTCVKSLNYALQDIKSGVYMQQEFLNREKLPWVQK